MDLDGTIFDWGTNNFLPGAVAMIEVLKSQGCQIIFVTQRESAEGVAQALRHEGIPGPHNVFSGILNPRVVVNDQGAGAHYHEQNTPWNAEEVAKLVSLIRGL
jgi:hydroxymethylpyrimidine pyrophosphatase-like HAD family hydrolase